MKMRFLLLAILLVFTSGGEALAQEFRINVGGGDFVDSSGNLFVADKAFVPGDFGYVGGQTNTFGGDVAGTTDDLLYQSMRGQTSFSYIFDNLPAGDYEITLYFTEPFWNSAGERIFNVSVEGVVALSNFDIWVAGGHFVAVTQTFTSNVSDGQLNIDFVSVQRVAIVSGISVVLAVPEPNINVSPASLDFVDVETGSSSDQTVTLSNTGSTDLEVASLTTTNAVFSILSPTLPFAVLPGGFQEVTVRFSPLVAGTQSGELQIASNDPDQGLATVSLVGNGVEPPPDEPDIDVSPGSVDFGPVVVNEFSEGLVTVTNTGTQTLTVTGLALTNAAFSVVSPGVPFDVAASGGSAEVTVRFSPTGVGSEAGTLEITSNDPDEGLVAIPLAGEGIDSLPVEFRINVGGSDFTDSSGQLFVADKAFVPGDFGNVGGRTDSFSADVAGTTDDLLYQTMRGETSFSYLFDGLPVGDYEITLYFVESIWNNVGGRIFDVSIEAVVALDNYDIVGVSGGRFVAVTETFIATVSDGQLNIDFVGVQRLAVVSAISVVPAVPRTFADVAAQVGLVLSHELGSICNPPIGSGSAWADYDNDGDIDLFVTNRGGPNHLYRNDGDTDSDGLPNFTDVAVGAGVDDPSGAGHGAVFVDYDNDGDQDLYVTNWGGNTLYQNQLIETNSAVFVDVTAVAGVGDAGRAITAAWADFDQDGFLDLYIAKHKQCSDDPQSQDHLFHNKGGDGSSDVTFTDVTGWLCPGGAAPCAQVLGLGFSPGWLDYDNDGDLDLYLVNDDIGQAFYPNVLWRNDGSDGLGGWVFTDVSTFAGADQSLNGMGLGVGDYDNDGWLDLAFSNIGPNFLLRNLGNTTFDDVSAAAGIQRATLPGGGTSITWGTVFFDHDNDSWLDLMFVAGNTGPGGYPNAFFGNNRDGTFTDLSVSSGLDDSGRGRNASIVDFDGDGFVDVFIGNYGETPRLFHNRSLQQGNSNQWITLTVEGTDSNRDGIGTRLLLTTPDAVTQIREINSGPTHGGGDYRAAYFGLGV